MSDFRQRLEKYLAETNQSSRVTQLTPDASTREYFRVTWNGAPAVACVYPEVFAAREQNYLDVTNLFLVSGLPVAKIYDFSEQHGTIILEDLGNTILRDVLLKSGAEKRERLLDEAIGLIARIQTATAKAFEIDSIAAHLKFDEEKLLWELRFFKEHYFESFKKQPLSIADDNALTGEFVEISRSLESRAAVLCHRDFHTANLMLDQEKRLRIIDHQDARIGSAAYDLVSLLLDRVSAPPSVDWVRQKRAFFLNERENLGLEVINPAEFAAEFDLQTIQRCLKAAGTFSYQSTFRAKTHFIPFIKPMLQIVVRSAQKLDEFPNLQRILGSELDS